RPPDITRVVAKRGHTLSKLTIHSGPRPAAPPRWRCGMQDGVARRTRCLTMLAACPEIAEDDHRGVTPGRAGHATPRVGSGAGEVPAPRTAWADAVTGAEPASASASPGHGTRATPSPARPGSRAREPARCKCAAPPSWRSRRAMVSNSTTFAGAGRPA